jgi:hypothetical protein
MGEIREHPRVMFLVAAFSRYEAALDWARERIRAEWGPVVLESERFEHNETDYYLPTMGSDLRKTFFALQPGGDPTWLVDRKLAANQWEREYAREFPASESRPLNLDPGYLTDAKLILATTKDRDHRIYLGRGIFAENTLFFRSGAWCPRDWTYPDYHRADYHQFLTACRDHLRRAP